MSQDARQWLAEIKHLQQQLEDVRQERDEAFASAASWRALYDTEAKQRRADVAIAQEKIAELQDLLTVQHAKPAMPGTSEPVPDWIVQDVQATQSVLELQEKLMQALAQCDRLTEQLRTERNNHATTRQELTAALGDAIDQLARERGGKPPAQATPEPTPGPAPASAKSPSLELPTLDQAQFRP